MTPNFKAVSLMLLMVQATDAACKASGQYTLTGSCNSANLDLALGDACLSQLGLNAAQVCESLSIPFSKISQGGYHHDKNYFDGGTEWNNNEGKTSIPVEMGQVMRFEDRFAATYKVGWPAYSIPATDAIGNGRSQPSNFDQCKENTVMCCYVHDRFDGVLENLALDADVCHHDIKAADKSNHVQRGFTITKGNETNTNCFGFTWDDNAASGRFKANMLYDISMRKTLKNGYTKNVPGAPMCACIEQMPVVTKASCADVSVANEGGTLVLNTVNKTITGNITATITYGNCGGKTLKQSTTKDLSKYIVDSCDAPTEEFMNERFYIQDVKKRSTYMNIDTTKWQQFAGYGVLFYPYGRNMTQGDADLRKLLASSPNPIIYRYCPHCQASHVHLYYRRKTPIPSSVNFLNQLLNKFDNLNNTLFTDFLLYNDYNKAVQGANSTSFQFCLNDPNADVGFPHNCGELSQTWNMWNRYNAWMPSEVYHHSFFVEKPTSATQV